MKRDDHKKMIWKKVHKALRKIQKENKATIFPSIEASTNYIVECSNETYSILN